jgi:hypothetical protein
MLRNFLRVTTSIAFAFLFSASAHAQSSQTLNAAGAPPKILNVVHQLLIPGKGSAYSQLLGHIAETYSQARIPVYWIQADSLTGPTGEMSLNFFDSFADAEAVGNALAQAVASRPMLAQMQDQLLGYVSSETNSVAVRREGISYRANSVDFSKAHVLRVATILVRQGHEQEFEEAIKDLSAAYGRLNADAPWITYEVNAGAPSTTFVIFMPMHSLKEMDDYIARTGRPLREAEGDTISSRLQEIARDSYISWDSELYIVSPSTSHVPDEFAAGDPSFWRPTHR